VLRLLSSCVVAWWESMVCWHQQLLRTCGGRAVTPNV